jgi:glycosyltransferase A (GT-A) superfamily protein (DUF2064 family)
VTAQVLVLAKAPRPGDVKTRLCPPCTPDQAAAVALAALHDTLDAVDEAPPELVGRRLLVLEGSPGYSDVDDDWWPRAGWDLCPQRGTSLSERIGHAFADTAVTGLPSVLIGMDTPQVTGALLAQCLGELTGADAVLGAAADGGWWLLGLRDPSQAVVLSGVPTSRPDTGVRTRAALSGAGLSVAAAPVLQDVDTAPDAWRVADECRIGSRFVTAVARNVPPPGPDTRPGGAGG